MTRYVRTSLVAVLASALLLTLPAFSTAAPVVSTPAPAVADAASDRAREVLADVVAAFSAKPAARASRPTTDEHGRDVTLLLRDLRAALPALRGDDKRTAQTYLARPTDQPSGDTNFCGSCRLTDGTVSTSESQHFVVHYQSVAPNPLLGRNQVTAPEWLAETKSVLEKVYNAEINNLGYRRPKSDGPSSGTASNPNSKIDVYLVDIGDDGIYGYVSSDSGGAQVAPYIVLDNDYNANEFAQDPEESLRVTVAHEFFHAIQFAYDATETAWFTEGTAVWIEDIVYPTINDYLQYLRFSQIANPLQPANTTGGLERYGAVTFWKYLTEGFNSNSLIRSIWTAADFPRKKNGITAAKDVLKARGFPWVPAFARYNIWTTLPAGTYDDRALMTKYLDGAAKATLTRSSSDTGLLRVSINHLASAPLYVFPGSDLPTQAKLQISVNAPDTAQGTAARVQLRMRSGKVLYYSVALTSTGFGTRTVSFNRTSVAAAVVTLTNASVSINNQPFSVRARVVY